MSLRLPSAFTAGNPQEAMFDALNMEIASEKASALGRAGEQAATALNRLNAAGDDHPDRPVLMKAAAEAVHALFIQRELCGMRRHDAIIRDLAIPRSVLARLGAS